MIRHRKITTFTNEQTEMIVRGEWVETELTNSHDQFPEGSYIVDDRENNVVYALGTEDWRVKD